MEDYYLFLPSVRELTHGSGYYTIGDSDSPRSNSRVCFQKFSADTEHFADLRQAVALEDRSGEDPYFIAIGSVDVSNARIPKNPEGYFLHVEAKGILLAANTEQGLFYACCTWAQMLGQSGSRVRSATIVDWPTLPNRGLMVDISRGRVFTLDYLKQLVVQLSDMKMNVLQLYMEHTFQFSGKEQIWEGSGAMDAQGIIQLQTWCEQHFVQLQPNLQSFGHCNRILTTDGYRQLRESDLFWTLSPALPETYTFLQSLYDEFLPLFSSDLFNIDSDETYDLGSGKSKELMAEMGDGRLYLQHLLRLREMAAKHGKKIMVFGDVIVRHPELIGELPDDIVFLDWIYDPKPHYPTTSLFGTSGKQFWVCPGTGSWNSLFPRQDGATKNIIGLVGQGISEGAKGMLLCDWSDHGGYPMPKPCEYAYAVGAQMSWSGSVDSIDSVERCMDRFFGEPGFSQLHASFAAIYRLPALWSKNRSQCVIALFDEPLTGRTITAPLPPADLVALEDLPEGIEGVLDPESHHLMRPVFQLSEETLSRIDTLAREASMLADALRDRDRKKQYAWISNAFSILVEKVRLGREIRQSFLDHRVDQDQLLDWERQLRLLKQRFVYLQISYTLVWFTYAVASEIDISLTYFAHALERLDYLQSWITRQRIALQEHREPDFALATYETAGYRSLPSY